MHWNAFAPPEPVNVTLAVRFLTLTFAILVSGAAAAGVAGTWDSWITAGVAGNPLLVDPVASPPPPGGGRVTVIAMSSATGAAVPSLTEK